MLSQYSNLQQFHRGRTHTLFRAKRIGDGVSVVVKTSSGNSSTIHSSEIALLQNEYKVLRQCAGPGIVKALSLAPFGTKIALVLEDAGPKTLADVLQSRRLDLPTFLRMAIRLAEIIGQVHDCGFIHQDLEPSNIVFSTDESTLTLIDFARASAVGGSHPKQVSPSSLDRSLNYISPEQTGRMNRSVDHRSDLYSLGIIFYEILTGRVPFSSGDPLELVHAHLSRPPISPRECNPAIPNVLSDIVLRLIAKAPEDRYHSAYGLLQDLLEVQHQLQTDGMVQEFSTGMHDRPKGLFIPERLYGRSAECARLMDAFQRVARNGVPELVLVSGVSGVGKTALVRELYRPLTKERGLFASGKFDQHKRDVPFCTVAQAFREAVRYVLTESEQSIVAWTKDLKEALGLSGGLIANLIPEIELLVGKQPAVPQLSPADEEKRFDWLFGKFVEVFARKDHPLVVFLDDLQWADPASLRVLRNLICNSGPLHLLLIGAYRDNEVDELHPLSKLIFELRKRPVALEEIALLSLSSGHLSSLVSDSLGCSPDSAQPLVNVLFEKTQGNPFFAVQFLKSLYHEKLLTFNQSKGIWEWDLVAVDAVGYSDNVIDLLVDKMMKLPIKSRNLLIRAACLGNKVDVSILEKVAADRDSLDHDIDVCVDAGLLLRVDDSIKFLHDRVQQAAYSLIDVANQAATHLELGRMLLESPEHVVEERIFDVVNQLNQGASLLDDAKELEHLVALNYQAGCTARKSTAYGSAIKYFAQGIEMLPSGAWKNTYQLAYDLHFSQAECEWLLGNYEQAEAQFEHLLTKSRSKLNKADIYRMQVELCISKVELSAAVEKGLTGLRLLGINISAHPSRDEVLREYENIWKNIGGRSIEDLVNLPGMDSREMVMAMDILVALYAAMLCTDQNLFILAACHMVNITLKHGNCNASAMGYGFLGMGLGPVFGKFEDAYRFGKLGYDLVALHGLSGYKAKINFIFGDTINYFRNHLRSDMDYLDLAFEAAVEVGDIPFACYSCNHICANLIALGEPLDVVFRETERRLEYTGRVNFDASYQAIFSMQKFVKNLRGETNSFSTFSDQTFDESAYDAMMASYGQPIVTCWYYILKVQAKVMFGQFKEAKHWAEMAKPLLWSTIAHIQEQEYLFYAAIGLAGAYPELNDSEKLESLKTLELHHDKMKTLTEACAANFAHKYYLICAEIARIKGDVLAAEQMYCAAIKSARENGYMQNEGLANERFGSFFMQRGLDSAALGYLESARSCYQRWGADAKVAQLEQMYPVLQSRNSSEPLDLMAVFKAARAISSEVVLDRLLETLMQVVVTSSGARKGVLVLEEDGELIVRSHGPLYREKVPENEDQAHFAIVEIPLDSYWGAPRSVLNYVSRAKESVLLNNAAREGVFALDPYIRENGTRSVLCFPMIKQERLVGVLYLENSIAPSVFTRSRLEFMQLLTSQIVTALENGALFDAMRKEVAERKRAEEALRVSEQHFRSAFELASVAMVQIDIETHKFLRVNARYCQMLGYSAHELLNMTVEDVTLPEHVESDRQAWYQLATGMVNDVSLEKRYRRKDGKIVRVQVNAALLRYRDGKPHVTIAVVHELSKKRKTTETLEKNAMRPEYRS